MTKAISVRTRFLKLAAAALFCLIAPPSAVEARGVPTAAIDGGRELYCLALNIYFEARSESEAGKFAVGHVVMNRVAHRRFPQSICRVIRQGGERRRNRCQFSWWCDGQSDKPRDAAAWDESRRIAMAIYAGTSEDPTDGALWYHADYVKPAWRKDFQRGPKIGRHVFYAIEELKRVQTETNQYFAMVPVSADITAENFGIGGDDFTERMIMLFGFGLIGLGLIGGVISRNKPI